MKLHLH